MTLETACTPRVSIVGNGTLGPYSLVDANSVPIRLVSTSHLKLTRYAASTDDNNDGSLLVLNTDYTVGGTQDARTFTLIGSQAVVTSSQRILAERVQSYTQDLDLTTGGAFNAASVESRFDKVAEFQQELKARLDRVPQLQYLDATTNVAFPTPPTSATAVLGRNTAGEIVHVEAADLDVDVVLGTGWSTILGLPAAGTLDNLSGVRFVATYAALTALVTATGLSDGATYFTYTRAGTVVSLDGGHGHWVYNAASTATANGGTILAIDGGGAGRFFRIYAGAVITHWFGVLASASSATNITAFHAARDAAGVNGEIETTIPGTYFYEDLLPNVAGQHWKNAPGVILKQKALSTGAGVRVSGAGAWLEDFTMDGNRSGSGVGAGGIVITADDVKITNLYIYETKTYCISGSAIQRWHITGKFRTHSLASIFFDMSDSAAADLEGGYIDVDDDFSGETNSNPTPLAGGVVIRGDETATKHYYTNCIIKARVKGIDNPWDSFAACVELRALKNGHIELVTVGGGMGLSSDNLLGTWTGTLNAKSARFWGLEIGGTNGRLHFSGSIDMSDSAGTARGGAAILSGDGPDTTGSLQWDGPLSGCAGNGADGAVIVHRAARKLMINGDVDANGADYLIYDNAGGNWHINGRINGSSSGNYAAYMYNSPGGCVLDGRVTGFSTGILNIVNDSAVTTDDVDIRASCPDTFTPTAAITTALSGGGAIGEQVRASGMLKFTATKYGNILDHKNGVIRAWGLGSPETALIAGIGSSYLRNDGGVDSTIYSKTSGAIYSNSAWTAIDNV